MTKARSHYASSTLRFGMGALMALGSFSACAAAPDAHVDEQEEERVAQSSDAVVELDSYSEVAAFSADDACSVDRGASNGLFVFNHFLTPLGSVPVGWGFMANNDAVISHVERCRQLRARLPNFVTVDWYNEGSYGSYGSLVNFVNSLNSTSMTGPATAL